ncbi:type VII secretion protein EssC [Macrococcoides canis]|uniref:type VII secretion protein EssC n=1 Tax=Macrococcoides canis TaxID=1855823 RepID=UPI001F29CD4E|nr:type VII secretion protein EssC [Macrococcus canis]UJS27267.1 type VII secretion protein EssC [Macrococcus canis]
MKSGWRKWSIVNEHVTPALLDEQFDKEKLYRKLANINHVENLKNTIPESISFMQLYKAKYTDELDIPRRWKESQSYKNMAVLLGVRGKDDIVHLNLHEKAHGPHGLIAGTTGSGKSEIIQSYILSLAVNFHPHEVAFLLIDYKGSGMANLFKDLPHLVGTITNLDGASSMRALTSIKAELKKRQRLFNENEVNHINQYHKLIQDGKQLEPMPHLFLISDEFAELKQEQPDFMKELVSTARIGRSLGIHLILATQKPSGVVNDQIWSNSKFKLALKVQNKQDSNEILKTPDAADITLPGRAYLQVGNNEIYELFQSAWSGANYAPDDSSKTIDKTLYQINHYGQYENVTRDLSGLDEGKVVETKTELEAVIDEVKRVKDALQVTKVKTPWLPPLKKVIYQDELVETDFKKLWSDDSRKVELLFGYKDVPEEQLQENYLVDVSEMNQLLLIGSSRYGKTTFLQNSIVYLARNYSPNIVQMYILDFGSSSLIQYSKFPHVIDYLKLDEEEKISKFITLIRQFISERKRLFTEKLVSNLEEFNMNSKYTLPRIMIVIDNYDAIKEEKVHEQFDEVLTKVTREGNALGINVLMTGNRIGNVRLNLVSNFKTKVSLHLFDKSDVSTILGSNKHMPEDIPGRAAINENGIINFQIPLPIKGENINQKIDEETEKMLGNYNGVLPKPIPMMPDELSSSNEEYNKIVNLEEFKVGLDYTNVKLKTLSLKQSMFLIADKPRELSLIESMIKNEVKRLLPEYNLIIFDENSKMKGLKKDAQLYIDEPLKKSEYIQIILKDIQKRINGEAYEKRWLIVFSNINQFINDTQLTIEELSLLFDEGPQYDVSSIITGTNQQTFKVYNSKVNLLKQMVDQYVLFMRISDQDILNLPYISSEKNLKDNEAYVIKEQEFKKVKIPNFEE